MSLLIRLVRLLVLVVSPSPAPVLTLAAVEILDRFIKPLLREARADEREMESRCSPSRFSTPSVASGEVAVAVAVELSGSVAGAEPDDSDVVVVVLVSESPLPGASVVVVVVAAVVGALVVCCGDSAIDGRSAAVTESRCPGTSRLSLVLLRVTVGLPTLIGNRPFSGPLERSRRCFWRGAGLCARLRSTIARCLLSMAARRLLSSVLIARVRPLFEIPCALDWRFNSPKITSL